jgi:ribosomal protein L25 (general stress protein Ctc)
MKGVMERLRFRHGKVGTARYDYGTEQWRIIRKQQKEIDHYIRATTDTYP